ncbi:MAG: undecaprenyl-diphosphate phosphatase [Oscillospiraceae bacterium]|jgi:undecaprenyl-diphosphatase
MKIWLAALLGALQGVTEFLPVSSSGHLAVFQRFFGLEEVDLFFDVLLHFATLVAIIVFYRKEIWDMLREIVGFFHDLKHPNPDAGEPKPARRLVLMIILATFPLFLILPFHDKIETLSNNTLFVGVAFLITGVILFLSDRTPNGRKSAGSMTVSDAVKIGLAQAVATLPGISRSGSTIAAGMATGLDRSFAVNFSFLMSLPAVLGATILEAKKALEAGINAAAVPAYLIGMVIAGVVGYFAIKLLQSLAVKGGFGKFCYYCFAIGALTIILTIVL